MRAPARALTVAGSDPTGGAGIQADLRTFSAHGVWGLSAITAVTVQDSSRVHSWFGVPGAVVFEQVVAVARDAGIEAAKTGMLPGPDQVDGASRGLADVERLVIDPVLASTSGDPLADETIPALRALLIPRAMLVTPNADEAAALAGFEVADRLAQTAAAHAIRALGARAVLVTGGHIAGDDVVDVLVDEEGALELRGPVVPGGPFHGTGCVLSAAITARLARGDALRDAVEGGRRFTAAAIARARGIGGGALVVDPGAASD
jgi:hydroxymethylpyrimidine/phosphomethylpyrimidine kinase